MRAPNEQKLFQQYVTSIETEQSFDPAKKSSFDLEKLLTTAVATYFAPLEGLGPKLKTPDAKGELQPDPTLVPRLLAYEAVARFGLSKLEEVKKKHDASASAGVRYTAAAHDDSKEVFAPYSQYRSRFDKRLPNTELARKLREAVGVGTNVPEDAPATVAKWAHAMLEALDVEEYAKLLGVLDIDVTIIRHTVKPPLDRLDEELQKTPSTSRKGEVSPEVTKWLVFVDIAFQRLCTFLEDHGCKAEAQIVQGRLPRKFSRRAGDVKGGNGETKPDAKGEANGEAKPEAKTAPKADGQADAKSAPGDAKNAATPDAKATP